MKRSGAEKITLVVPSVTLALPSALLTFLFALSSLIGPAHASGSGSWSAGGNLSVGRSGYIEQSLLDGRVLIATGFGGTATAELFDPVTNTWSQTGSLHVGRTRTASVRLQDGRVLVAGGRNSDHSVASVEIYNPATGSWSFTADLTTPRDWLALTLLADGRVLAAGGLDFSNGPGNPVVESAEIYNPATGLWAATGSMTRKRWGMSAITLNDGTVLVAGGAMTGTKCEFAPTAETFDPAMGLWQEAGRLAVARGFYRATLLSSGKVLFVGGNVQAQGQDCFAPSAATEVYDPAARAFTRIQDMAHPRAFNALVNLLDGRTFAAGGRTLDASGAPFPGNTAEFFDPITETWSTAASMSTGRGTVLGALLADGRVVVAGGGSSVNPLASTEIFTP